MFRWPRRIGVCLLPCTPTWGGDMGSAGRRMRKAVIGGVVLAAGLLLAPWVPALAAPAQQCVLTARGGAGPVVTVALDTAGRLSLSVRRGATQVLQSSPIGVRTSAADLATGLRFTGRADTRVTGEYTTLTGRRRQHTVDANQTTLSFTKGGSRLDLVFRVSTDGFGYRYVIRQSGAVNVTADTTELAVPTTARAVLLPYETGRNDYENVHVHTTVAQSMAIEYGYPSLFRVGDTWLLLTESDLDGTYGGTRLTFSTTTHRFRVTLADPQETSASPDRNAFPATHYTDLPFTRNLAGSMDYTPVTFTAKRTNTEAAELAQAVVFESGLQNFADSLESYDARPVAERLLRQVPVAWDETRLTSGNPDTHVILARRNGTNWYVGAITAGGARTLNVPLAFLGTGSWLADLYADGRSGGFSVRLCPAAPGATSCG